jgi:hypothetical protein
VSADIVPLLRYRASQLLSDKSGIHNVDASTSLRLAAHEIERLRAELVSKADELRLLRERVTMLVEAAAEDARRAARLERVITNKEPLL